MANEILSTEHGIIEEINTLNIDDKIKERILSAIKMRDDTITTLRRTTDDYKDKYDKVNYKALIYKNALIELIKEAE